ncbi:zygote arrest protein 1 [Notechis scutatus]|uniref:Zygote arrest protein 1 n=1 Tax=Notechis scutatus TaxID=8663 RepID=A0A6J1UN62_9SAUR|nr:zygote arrest protein 1 [Notechis scutatus]
METLMDEAMESYAYPSYNPYSYRYQPPKSKSGQGAWRHHHYQQHHHHHRNGGGGGYLSGYSEAMVAAAAEYFDNYQRAQLKAILSQVNPNLTPRLRKANTKEVGVQVNPRQDASVQCSLGPRPLLFRSRARGGGGGGGGGVVEQERGCLVSGGAARHVRFPRTIAVYSPVASRRLPAFLEEPEHRGEGRRRSPRRPGSPSKPQAVSSAEEGEKWQGEEGAPQALGEEAEADKARVRFQFLEQKYGYYHCKDCNIRWESAYVWCVQGTSKVYFRQFCRTCQKSYNPYRVEDITCQSCKQTRCSCSVKLRHVDPKRPHRQDLCGRCKGKRLSCDSTFSFKYII